MDLMRTVTIAVDGRTKTFAPGADLSGLSRQSMGRLQRAGAFGDSAEALGVKTKAPEADEGEGVNLKTMTVPDLRAYAETNGIDLGEATRKADILAAIEEAEKG